MHKRIATVVALFLSVLLGVVACEREQARPDAGPHVVYGLAVGANAVLGTTGSTSSNSLVIAGRHTVRSASVTNLTGSNMWATFQDQATTPTGFTNMTGSPVFVPANYQVILGTDFFGVDGWAFGTGVAVAMTTTGSSDAGGTWTAAGSACCDITVNGQ